ncbi:hypothetical protein [Polaribacter septentrionalilitoris]|uniref:hypothetical protein n=1 Tax=Polaribacter septentrionalilitoris TaxID=2494657 RepID=UPI00135C6C5C|nr:hypothetical protein [Polaribacter septentrionalilitoris]
MKNFKNKLFLVLVLSFAIYVNAQDYLMTLNPTSLNFIDKNATEYKGEPLIKDKSFTYNYNGGEVFVTFKGDEHIEFHNNKQHFIKSKLFWVSKDLVYVTIEDYTLPNFPFKRGTKMKIEFTKVKDGFVEYKSTLGGRTWLGKMKESKLE